MKNRISETMKVKDAAERRGNLCGSRLKMPRYFSGSGSALCTTYASRRNPHVGQSWKLAHHVQWETYLACRLGCMRHIENEAVCEHHLVHPSMVIRKWSLNSTMKSRWRMWGAWLEQGCEVVKAKQGIGESHMRLKTYIDCTYRRAESSQRNIPGSWAAAKSGKNFRFRIRGCPPPRQIRPFLPLFPELFGGPVSCWFVTSPKANWRKKVWLRKSSEPILNRWIDIMTTS